MRYQWIYDPIDVHRINAVSRECGLSVLTAAILVRRGLEDIEAIRRFLKPSVSHLHDPFLLKDMDKAVTMLRAAIREKKKILLYGDYDVDGITATAIAFELLRGQGATPSWRLPERKEGYGFNKEFLRHAAASKPDIIVALDCGSTEQEAVKFLAARGITVIVLDHHQIDDARFPHAAYAVINPLQKQCTYPFKELAGCGLALKLAQAFGVTQGSFNQFLELAALGTVCDVAPLIDENRIIAKFGMELLPQSDRKGLRALMKIASVRSTRLRTEHLSFMLGPRLNATGRMASPRQSLELLLEEDVHRALALARAVDEHNKNRKALQELILKDAMRRIENTVDFARDKAIVLHDERWHTGLLGIVASRIADRFYRPCLLIGKNEHCMKGSGRSVKEFNLFQALDACKDLLVTYGGHELAVGFSLEAGRIDEFTQAFTRAAHEQLGTRKLVPTHHIDAWVGLGDLRKDFFEELAKLEPFGEGNEAPFFATEKLSLHTPSQRKSRRYWVGDGNHVAEVLVPFELKDAAAYIEKTNFDMLYTAQMNDWSGHSSLELSLKDVRVALGAEAARQE